MIYKITILILLCLNSIRLFPQSAIMQAHQEMELYNFQKAASILETEYQKKGEKTNGECLVNLADCYRMMNDMQNAVLFYGKALAKVHYSSKISTGDPGIYLHYAQTLRSTGNYNLAKKYFLVYDSLVPGQKSGQKFVAWCDSALIWSYLPGEIEIYNLKQLNTPQSEFGPAFYQEGIVFTSDRSVATTNKTVFGWTGNSFLNLYYSTSHKTDTLPVLFQTPSKFDGFADQHWHVGPATFNRNGSEVYLTRTQLTRDKGKKEDGSLKTHLLKIYFSTRKDNQWSALQPFFLNSDNYSTGHPSLSVTGDTLFFVSDMPGGLGQTDIWFCIRKEQGWSDPLNAGPSINSDGKEMFPFISRNGDLWFASDGRAGLGGLDLFVARQVGGNWQQAENLKAPLNSSWDDFSLITTNNPDSGVFSSNRPGGAGADDLYLFTGRTPKPDTVITVPPIARLGEPDVQLPDTLVVNKSYRIENILYDFDKWDIRESSKPALNNLIHLMKEYPITVELSSHTDCRGSEAYNLLLSQKRAESAVNYIVASGIPASRIIAKGYGKSKLLNHCDCASSVICSEADHQLNRRTEFKVIDVTH